jgi:hypothetical protein
MQKKWNIGDIVIDEDGCTGVVCIKYADGDICTIENDAAHPNPSCRSIEDADDLTPGDILRALGIM